MKEKLFGRVVGRSVATFTKRATPARLYVFYVSPLEGAELSPRCLNSAQVFFISSLSLFVFGPLVESLSELCYLALSFRSGLAENMAGRDSFRVPPSDFFGVRGTADNRSKTSRAEFNPQSKRRNPCTRETFQSRE